MTDAFPATNDFPSANDDEQLAGLVARARQLQGHLLLMQQEFDLLAGELAELARRRGVVAQTPVSGAQNTASREPEAFDLIVDPSPEVPRTPDGLIDLS